MNSDTFNALFRYQLVMTWVRSLLKRSLITKAEYAKIDTRIAQKYGISSCSIKSLTYPLIGGNMVSKEVVLCGES